MIFLHPPSNLPAVCVRERPRFEGSTCYTRNFQKFPLPVRNSTGARRSETGARRQGETFFWPERSSSSSLLFGRNPFSRGPGFVRAAASLAAGTWAVSDGPLTPRLSRARWPGVWGTVAGGCEISSPLCAFAPVGSAPVVSKRSARGVGFSSFASRR